MSDKENQARDPASILKALRNTPRLSTSIEPSNINETELILEVLADAARRAEDTDKIARQAERRVESLGEGIADLDRRYASLFAQVSKPEIDLEAFKSAVMESLKLQEARKLWTHRAVRAFYSYVTSSIVLVALLVAVPGVAIWQSEAIFGFFRAIGEAVLVDLPETASETAILIAAISRLVLVTLPVLLFIWLIRIVVRFNTRSLLLMDDANQRNTMLETYLHLVEHDATMKADRPLILEALFRRTPGHGPESIDPPNLADVMNLNFARKPD